MFQADTTGDWLPINLSERMDFTLNDVTSSIQADLYRKETFQFSLEGTSFFFFNMGSSIRGEWGWRRLEAVVSIVSATNKIMCCSSS